jgi:hypothetical protein
VVLLFDDLLNIADLLLNLAGKLFLGSLVFQIGTVRDASKLLFHRTLYFKEVSGSLTYTETTLPVLADASNNPVFFASTGGIIGTVSGVAAEQEP